MPPPQLLAELAPLLRIIADPSTGDLREATQSLHQMVIRQPSKTLILLAQVGAQGSLRLDYNARVAALLSLIPWAFESMTGLYLDRHAGHRGNLYELLDDLSLDRIEKILHEGLRHEEFPDIRRRIAICAGRWTDGFRFNQDAHCCRTIVALVVGLVKSGSVEDRIIGFTVLAHSPRLLATSWLDPSPTFSDVLRLACGDVLRFLSDGFQDDSVDVALLAYYALTEMMINEGDLQHKDGSCQATLLGKALDSLARLPWASRAVAFKHLDRLAATLPHLFGQRLEWTVEFLLSHIAPDPVHKCQLTSIPRNPDFDPSDTLMCTAASELLITLVKKHSETFQLVAYETLVEDMVGSYMGSIINSVGNGDNGGIQEWIDAEEYMNVDRGYAAECLSRMSHILTEDIYHVVKEHAVPLLPLDDWRCSYSVLISLANVTEGCRLTVDCVYDYRMLKKFGLHSSPDPRVRYAWLQMVHEYCVHLGANLQKSILWALVSDCLPLLRDPVIKVRTRAAHCIGAIFRPECYVYLFTFGTPELLEVVMALFTAHDEGPLCVKRAAMKSLTAVAVSYGPYRLTIKLYRPWMDKLLEILQSDDEWGIRGLAIETATTIIEIVDGPPRKLDPLIEIPRRVPPGPIATADVKILSPIIIHYDDFGGHDHEDYPVILDSWDRLAITLQEPFVNFFEFVIPRLLLAAAERPHQDATEVYCPDPIQRKTEALKKLTLYVQWIGLGISPSFPGLWTTCIHTLQQDFPVVVKSAALPLILELVKMAKRKGLCDDPIAVRNIWADVCACVVRLTFLDEDYMIPLTMACYQTICDLLLVIGILPSEEDIENVFECVKDRAIVVEKIRQGRRSFTENEEIQDHLLDYADHEIMEGRLLAMMDEVCKVLMTGAEDEHVTKDYQVLHALIDKALTVGREEEGG